MPLVDQVEALWRSLFGAGTQPPLIDAVEQMLGRVGIPSTGSLPSDVDALMAVTGMTVAAPRVTGVWGFLGAQGVWCSFLIWFRQNSSAHFLTLRFLNARD